MVNHDLDPIYGTAPYMTSPTDTYSLAKNWSAITHPSEPKTELEPQAPPTKKSREP